MAKARRIKAIDCEKPALDNAREIVKVRLNELLSFGPYVSDPANVTELHDLRIAAKRLRYTLELFRFALPSDVNGLIDEVKEIQEHIGDMHDADVMIERITEQLRRDASARLDRLLEIASAIDRGTVAQRHQRIRSALTNRTTPRDEVALLTLIAHRADDRERAYHQFVATWRRMEASEFPRRLKQCVGIERRGQAPPVTESDAVEPEVAVEAAG
ncbi:MAG TPA: CHAD domain-containing protein [Thermomicrobiales bacterium]|nr:CHAD domain-containing protein [Thermomicrobiales bacterium]